MTTVARVTAALAPIPVVTSYATVGGGVAYLSPLASDPVMAGASCWTWARSLTVVGAGIDLETSAQWITERMLGILNGLFAHSCAVTDADTEIGEVDGLEGPTTLLRIIFREDAH